MADRTAAEIFSKVFDILAKEVDETSVKAAQEIWDEMANYDFIPRQLHCDDESLVSLGLAKWVSAKILNEKYPDEGYREDSDTLIYIDDEIWDEVE